MLIVGRLVARLVLSSQRGDTFTQAHVACPLCSRPIVEQGYNLFGNGPKTVPDPPPKGGGAPGEGTGRRPLPPTTTTATTAT